MQHNLQTDHSIPTFTSFTESTAEDWHKIEKLCDEYERGLADRVLNNLQTLKGSTLGFPVDRYEHSLQAATRALRDGADEETVVCILLHDIGDDIAPYNHGELVAAILKPYISPENHWMLSKHAIFQGYYYFHHIGRDQNERDKYRGHPAFERTARFCERWDQTAFDPNYDTLPLEHFEPMVRRIFGRPSFGGVKAFA
jgi:predicted HD phosphohydrolase